MAATKLIIFLCGLYSLGFAVFHAWFWRIFKWKKELQKISPANRAIMQIANLRLIYFFLFVGFVCFFYPDSLKNTALGNVFLLGISVFWLGRTIEQFIFLRMNNRLVTLLTYIFMVGTLLFGLPVFLKS